MATPVCVHACVCEEVSGAEAGIQQQYQLIMDQCGFRLTAPYHYIYERAGAGLKKRGMYFPKWHLKSSGFFFTSQTQRGIYEDTPRRAPSEQLYRGDVHSSMSLQQSGI